MQGQVFSLHSNLYCKDITVQMREAVVVIISFRTMQKHPKELQKHPKEPVYGVVLVNLDNLESSSDIEEVNLNKISFFFAYTTLC
jgi:hypothetical protein